MFSGVIEGWIKIFLLRAPTLLVGGMGGGVGHRSTAQVFSVETYVKGKEFSAVLGVEGLPFIVYSNSFWDLRFYMTDSPVKKCKCQKSHVTRKRLKRTKNLKPNHPLPNQTVPSTENGYQFCNTFGT